VGQKYKWKIIPPLDSEHPDLKQTSLQSSFVKTFYQRRFLSKDALMPSKFSKGTLEDVQEPFDIPDLIKGASCLISHLENGNKVAIFSDYDVDGICGGILLKQFITEAYPDAQCHIFQSNRMIEGYGLNLNHVEKIQDYACLVTVDCGSSSIEPIQNISDQGCDVIVTDHHECALNQEQKVIRPAAIAFINPKRPDAPHYFSFLSGTGVVFMLCCAMRKSSEKCAQIKLAPFLDLVCTSIISDAVPLLNENRIFVRYGLNQFNSKTRPYFKKLMDHTTRYGPINEQTLSFSLIPKMNAPGRMGSASPVLEGLMAKDTEVIDRYYRETVKQNESRMEIQAQSWSQVEPLAEAQKDQDVLCVYHPEIHEGVLGILASRLCDQYQKPAIVMAQSQIPGEIKGSGRAFGTASVLDVAKKFSGYFSRFGGHQAAIGLSLHESNLKPLLDGIAKFKQPSETIPLLIEESIKLRDLNYNSISELESLGPFGQQFPLPLFLIEDIRIPKLRKLKGDHLKGIFEQDGAHIDFIAWKSGHLAKFINGSDHYNCVVNLKLNYYVAPTVQCELVDIEKAQS
jgi:single-stranded-DNA-specific exonuclease